MTTHSPIRRPLVSGLAMAAATLLWAGPANADLITVTNSSFESATISDGGTGASPGWTGSFSGGGSIAYNPTEAYFTGAAGSGTPVGADGANVLSCFSPASGNYAGAYQVITGAQLTASVTYKLTVAVGDYNNQIPTAFRLAISTASMGVGTYLAIYTGTAAQLTNDQFTDFSVQYTATGLETQIGQNLRITAWGQNVGSGTYVALDNFRFESSIIPEPGTIALLGAGTLLLLAARRRRLRGMQRQASATRRRC